MLCNLFYSVLSNPEIYKRLQAEVDHFYPRGEDSLDPKHHTEMPYMEAVMYVVARFDRC